VPNSAACLADPLLDCRNVRAVQALDIALGRFRTLRFHAVSRPRRELCEATRLSTPHEIEADDLIERGERFGMDPVKDARRDPISTNGPAGNLVD
jgi:hypothetical protein